MRCIGALLLAVSLWSCDDASKPPPPLPSPAAPAASTAATPPSSARSDEALDVPTEQDFEAEAEREITAENLERELDALEKEIGADG